MSGKVNVVLNSVSVLNINVMLILRVKFVIVF